MTEHALAATVTKLLNEDVASVIQREQTAFDRALKSPAQRLVLFGAGGLGKKTLAGLRKVGVEPLAFADNNPALWNKKMDGLLVLPVEEAVRRHGHEAAFIVTIWKGEATDRMAQRIQQLLDLGCATVLPFGPLFWKYADVFLPHYAFDVPHKVYEQAEQVKQACSLWGDEASRREYLAQVRWRALHDFNGLPDPVEHEIYFPDDLVAVTPQETFVDCGAFDGDTLATFVKRQGASFGRIVAFEPDPANFEKLAHNVRALPAVIRDKITVRRAAVGARTEKVTFAATGTEASAVGAGTLEVDCVDLDGFLNGTVPTYIKMDIEGSEPDALAGARRRIEKHLPVLALCVYHRQDHLWRIPLFVRSLSEQYRFFLRPHLLEVWDLVCYAVPVSRLRSSR